MFTDMVKKLPELGAFIKKLGRPLRVATMCSGTESPLLALDKIGNACEHVYGAKLNVDHVFSCEIEPFKQAYIERNFAPPILFRTYFWAFPKSWQCLLPLFDHLRVLLVTAITTTYITSRMFTHTVHL